jgi:hypothetical protein
VRALHSKKDSVARKCGHLAELVIDSNEGGRICCECWAQDEEATNATLRAQLRAAQTDAEGAKKINPLRYSPVTPA